jgi:hypothetical protein
VLEHPPVVGVDVGNVANHFLHVGIVHPSSEPEQSTVVPGWAIVWKGRATNVGFPQDPPGRGGDAVLFPQLGCYVACCLTERSVAPQIGQ